MKPDNLIREKISEVKNQMKRMGIWKNSSPDWVKNYEQQNIHTAADFCEWFQFVYLPNRLLESVNNETVEERTNIVPQAKKVFGSDAESIRLLQLLIELDSLY